jgi:hypothetical protein
VSDLAELRSRLFRSSAAHCIFSAEARRLLRPIPESGNTASNPHLSRATRASRNALLCAFRQVNKPFQAALRPDRERQRIAKGGNFLEARSRARRKISGRNTAERRCSRQVRVARIARHYRGFTAKTNPTVRLNGWTFKTPLRVPRKQTNPTGSPARHRRLNRQPPRFRGRALVLRSRGRGVAIARDLDAEELR